MLYRQELPYFCGVSMQNKTRLSDDLSERFLHSLLGHTGNHASDSLNKGDTEGQMATEVSGPHSCLVTETAQLL